MNWNDELCGVKVAPESWNGGVMEWAGDDRFPPEWVIAGHHYTAAAGGASYAYLSIDGEKWNLRVDKLTPIFPPRGWAGKSDAELWREVVGEGPYLIEVDPPHFVGVHCLHHTPPGLISLTSYAMQTCSHNMLGAYTVAALILALQNAQVLARRLA